MRPKREPAVGHPPAPSSSTHDDRRQLSRYYYYCPRAFEGKPSKQTKYSLSLHFFVAVRAVAKTELPPRCVRVYTSFSQFKSLIYVLLCAICVAEAYRTAIALPGRKEEFYLTLSTLPSIHRSFF